MAIAETPPPRKAPAYYTASVQRFLGTQPNQILGNLVSANERDLEAEQKGAWEMEIAILRESVRSFTGTLYLEFDIPRLGSRVDAILVSGPAVFPIEFKCGESHYHTADYNQAWDYGLDLKNFHKASHDAPVLPILVATDAATSDADWKAPHPDGVRPPIRCSSAELRRVLLQGLEMVAGAVLDGATWGTAPYQPTPTIIEAARALYSKHSVEAISRNDAGARNLRLTSGGVESVIERSRRRHEKAIVFVTGVPGAGKTLVGLNVATRRRDAGEAHAVFLSGNGPLVEVLQEALTRDEMARLGPGARKGAVRQKVKPFIQNIHHFRDEGLRNTDAPYDHVVIFDEAQRAWDLPKTADFMKRRKKIANFPQSESEFLIAYLDRHHEWAVIVCLVGGGQEIHTGEAGIAEWLDAVRKEFPTWRLYISPHLTDTEYASGHALDAFKGDARVEYNDSLHLSTSMRSFRSEKVSAFVKAVLDLDETGARSMLEEIARRYPVALTRDIARAKRWVKDHARGSERYGLVASSQAFRLKPHAIDIRVKVDPVHWFLNDRHDTRSSYYLEDPATEFQIQGLELDWICVTWDADLRRCEGDWCYREFRGVRWNNIKAPQRKRYLLNAYRVLLTRARQGMVIFVPQGDEGDPTRSPAFYDETHQYLARLGMEQV